MKTEYSIRVFLKGGADVDIVPCALNTKSYSGLERSARCAVEARYPDQWERAVLIIRRRNYWRNSCSVEEIPIENKGRLGILNY